MRQNRLAGIIALMLCVCSSVLAVPNAKVSVRNGNVVVERASKTTHVTKTGRNSDPQLSPDGRWIVYVHAVSGKSINAGSGESAPNEIWRIAADGTHAERLIASHDNPDVKKILAGLSVPQFSPDGRQVYFLSAAWATSNAVHAIDLATKRERYVCDANSLHVVMRGEHQGCLIVSQHKYFVESGSYDWHWLVDKNGKEIGPMGDNDKLDSESD